VSKQEASTSSHDPSLNSEERERLDRIRLAEERKKLLEASKETRRAELDAHRQRAAAIEESLRQRREEERKERLRQVEQTRADLQAVRAEEEARIQAAKAEAERRRREKEDKHPLARLRALKSGQRTNSDGSDTSNGRHAHTLSTDSTSTRSASPSSAAVESRFAASPSSHGQRSQAGSGEYDGGDAATAEDENGDDKEQSTDESGHLQNGEGAHHRTSSSGMNGSRSASAPFTTPTKLHRSSHSRASPSHSSFSPSHSSSNGAAGAVVPSFDVIKHHTQDGILLSIFDLLAKAAPTADEERMNNGSMTSTMHPAILSPAILPLTIIFSPDATPLSTYHSTPSGHVRCTPWSSVNPRSVFLQFEENVRNQRNKLIDAKLGSYVAPAEENELAAVWMSMDGSVPMQALSLLDVGVLLKKGISAVGSLHPTEPMPKEGFILQAYVFPPVRNPPSLAATLTSNSPPNYQPHETVYRCEFSSAVHFQCDRRRNKHRLYSPTLLVTQHHQHHQPTGSTSDANTLPALAPSSSSFSSQTSQQLSRTSHSLDDRLVTYKGSPNIDRLSSTESLTNLPKDPWLEQEKRESFALMRRICVNILKRINDACKNDVSVQRLCLYFKVGAVDGDVHLLYGDRLDLCHAASSNSPQHRRTRTRSPMRRTMAMPAPSPASSNQYDAQLAAAAKTMGSMSLEAKYKEERTWKM